MGSWSLGYSGGGSWGARGLGGKLGLVHFMWVNCNDVCLRFWDQHHVQGRQLPSSVFSKAGCLTNLSFHNKWWIVIMKRSWGCVVNMQQSISLPDIQKHYVVYFTISLQWDMKFSCREAVVP